MLINRKLEENVESVEEHATILAFRFGVATKENYDYLVRLANTMNIANQLKTSIGSLRLSAELNVLSKSIIDRYNRTNKFGISGGELKVMKCCVNNYDLYWKQQTTTFYNKCIAELNAYYAEVEKNRIANSELKT